VLSAFYFLQLAHDRVWRVYNANCVNSPTFARCTSNRS